jgi:hypothetical protein
MTARTSPQDRAGLIMPAWRKRTTTSGALLLAIAAVCALLLAVPGEIVTTKYLSDLFIILDGVHRVVSGQVPNREFHSALGPLGYYLPAVGYWISGSLGAAVPIGNGLLVLALAPAMAHVLGSRLRPAIALPFGAFLLLVLAVPINLGESVTSLSFAKFYNRTGWAALGTLLVMYLRPEQASERQERLDALCAAVLTLVMIYTKITYGLAALGFLGLLAMLDARQRRWVVWAFGLIVLVGIIVEAFWRSSMGHVADLLFTWQVSGGLRGTWGQIIDHGLGNLGDYVLLGLLAGLALRRSRSIRDGLFYAFCAIPGFLLINQNFQASGIITLHAGAAVAAETILRDADARGESFKDRWSVVAGTKLLFLALVLPTIVHSAVALTVHAALAASRSGEAIELPNLGRVRLAHLWTWNDHEIATNYLNRVRDGVSALAGLDPKPRGVLVLDASNPFSAGLGLEPPRGDVVGLMWQRNLNAVHFPPPESLLADVQIVMEPTSARLREPAEDVTARDAVRSLYAPHLAGQFDLVRETEHWRVHLRRAPRAGTSCSQCGGAPGLAAAAGAP